MKTNSLPGLFCLLVLNASFIHASPPADLPGPPIGSLGLPMGTFAVIEGVEHSPVTIDDIPYTFRAEIVNGQKLEKPVEIQTMNFENTLAAGKRYVLHGYENGVWVGSPPVPPGESSDPFSDWRTRKQPSFCFLTRFRLTSLEKENGVLLPKARPVDPKVPLAQPKFGQPGPVPPLGATGLPLGTYMTLTIGAPQKPTKAIVCQIIAINGNPPAQPATIAVPMLQVPSGSEQFTVHGFESGDWRGSLPLLESETKPLPQSSNQGFTLSDGIGPNQWAGPVTFAEYFLLTNWTNRADSHPPKK